MEPEENPLNLKDREPRQGEQFTEPKVGGLYPIAGIFVVGMILGGIAILFLI